MSRPTKHPKTGIYWLRKRVPADLEDKVGRKVVTKSLGTRDPEEAKRKHSEMLADLEAQWTSLRKGTRQITDREAHFLARAVGDRWLAQHQENPSEQLLWHTDIYEGMWTRYPLPMVKPVEGIPGVASDAPGSIPIENIFWKSMRIRCLNEAERIHLAERLTVRRRTAFPVIG